MFQSVISLVHNNKPPSNQTPWDQDAFHNNNWAAGGSVNIIKEFHTLLRKRLFFLYIRDNVLR